MNVEIIIPLKYLSNFGRTLEMQHINGEINVMLTWSGNYVISSNAAAKLYVPVIILSTQDNAIITIKIRLQNNK